jgi:hypothetical protein
MKWLASILALVWGCHAESTPKAVTPVEPPVGAAPPTAGSGDTPFDQSLHFKNGATGKVGDVAFTLRMLPKLIVAGPNPEIEQLQIEVTRGTEHAVLQVDTRNKRAAWGGVVIEFGYADVYHDEIELTFRRP